MNHPIALSLSALLALSTATAAFGENVSDYPTRQITIIVAVAPGSQADQFGAPDRRTAPAEARQGRSSSRTARAAAR